jgi:hypothetical protein
MTNGSCQVLVHIVMYRPTGQESLRCDWRQGSDILVPGEANRLSGEVMESISSESFDIHADTV